MLRKRAQIRYAVVGSKNKMLEIAMINSGGGLFRTDRVEIVQRTKAEEEEERKFNYEILINGHMQIPTGCLNTPHKRVGGE